MALEILAFYDLQWTAAAFGRVVKFAFVGDLHLARWCLEGFFLDLVDASQRVLMPGVHFLLPEDFRQFHGVGFERLTVST